MKPTSHSIKQIRSIFQVITLALCLLGLSWLTLGHSTAKSHIGPNVIAAPLGTTAVQTETATVVAAAANPVANAFINARPSSDGAEIIVLADGINATGNAIYLNIDPGVGGGGSKGAHAMTLSGTQYIAVATGFSPGKDEGSDGDDTMSITTTVGSEVMGTDKINFQRAFVQPTVTETIIVDNGAFEIKLLNQGTFSTDAYLLVMSTNVPPGSLPIGYRLVGSTYNLSPSGGRVESDKLMTLNLNFKSTLPNNSDPHTLTIAGWNKVTQTWEILEGDLFDDTDHLTFVTQRFGIYALATGPTWRDSFKEMSLTGLSARTNIEKSPDEALYLSGGAISGTAISLPITPTNAAAWGTLHFSATTSLTTGLTVDVLDTTDTPLLTNVSDGTDLSSLPPTATLKLRATLTSTVPGQTPRLHEWRVNWEPRVERVYLPLVVKGG